MKGVLQPLMLATFPLVILEMYNGLDDKDKEYFRRTREARFGHTLEQIVPQGERRTQQLAAVGSGIETIAKEITKHAGEGAVFFGGDSPVFADIALAGGFKALITCNGRDGEISKLILGNEWAAKFYAAFEKWSSVEA